MVIGNAYQNRSETKLQHSDNSMETTGGTDSKIVGIARVIALGVNHVGKNPDYLFIYKQKEIV